LQLYKELVDGETKFSEYFRMSQYTFNILVFLKKAEFFEKEIHPLETNNYTEGTIVTFKLKLDMNVIGLRGT
jgi:hypothetical protein